MAPKITFRSPKITFTSAENSFVVALAYFEPSKNNRICQKFLYYTGLPYCSFLSTYSKNVLLAWEHNIFSKNPSGAPQGNLMIRINKLDEPFSKYAFTMIKYDKESHNLTESGVKFAELDKKVGSSASNNRLIFERQQSNSDRCKEGMVGTCNNCVLVPRDRMDLTFIVIILFSIIIIINCISTYIMIYYLIKLIYIFRETSWQTLLLKFSWLEMKYWVN